MNRLETLQYAQNIANKYNIKVKVTLGKGAFAWYKKELITLGYYNISYHQKIGWKEYSSLQYLYNNWTTHDEKEIIQLIMLHEIAHILNYRKHKYQYEIGNLKPHGKEYQQIYFELLDSYQGIEL